MINTGTIYLDNAGTTPVDPQVIESIIPFLGSRFGNASSLHSLGQDARKALEDSRESISKILNCRLGEIVFTSGGTESDNIAIKGVASGVKAVNGSNHIITTKIEHHAVLHACEQLEKAGYLVTYLSVDKHGLIDLNELENAINDNTSLVSVMLANNEIGTIQSISLISDVIKQCSEKFGKKIFFHTDAVQGGGVLDLDVAKLGVDLMSLSGHKFHGPKGVGLLFIRKGTPIEPLIVGGGQERERRSGTSNVAGVVGFATALSIAEKNRVKNVNLCLQLRDKLMHGILNSIDNTFLNGHPTLRLPGNVNISFEGIEGETILLGLDMAGVCASSGSACSSGSLDPSHVLLAIGLNDEIARSSIRFTFGKYNSIAEIERVIDVLIELIPRLRSMPYLQ
tara:strand:- start:624 stop:1811 length:1188 start_codon:yes stop_codon:yes gene_type:complete